MRIAYVSTDEVNQSLAERMAAKCGAVICKLLSGDPPPDGLFDAILYNLDDVPQAERSAVLERLRGDKPDHPTAVHGYDITDEQVSILSRYGVAAARRLHPEPAPPSAHRGPATPRNRPARMTTARILPGSTWSSSTRNRDDGPAI